MNIVNLFSHIKSCRVCGDTASGFNFGALSCDSCKAFFRRNVIKEKAFECKNGNNNCLVIKSTRNDCQKCRMAKCLTIGMKLQLINKIIGKSSFSKIPKTISDLNQDLQPYDFRCIGKIMTAMECLPNEHQLPLVGHSTDQIYLANLTEHYARRTIKFCKNIEAFRSLKSDDQLQLIKSFFPELTAILMAFIYIENKDGLRLMNERENETIFVPLEGSQDFAAKGHANNFRQFALPLRVVMQNDVIIRNLIFTQILFKPRDDTSCSEYIKYNYYVYCHLLQKYLRFKFKCTGDRKFVSLMTALGSLSDISKIYKQYYENFSSNELHEIVRNLYNL